MASREEHSRFHPHEDARALVFVPCPDCGRGVRLSDDNRLADEPDTYECPSCDARFLLSEN
jgi:predicted RNA-binding Zn-ribbon protein involved in translation (DUF1610 family)